MTKAKTNVAIALSGGVDSSLTAYILSKKGYNVHAFTLLLTESENVAASKVAEFLKIPHTIIDLREQFQKEVIDYFLNSYEKGLTPSPCIVCNRKIKLGTLFDIAMEQGCEYLATGHYAKIENGDLYKVDNPKDQSYFLFNTKKENLEKIMFPLAEYTKDEVREMAKEANIPTHNKKDSQDVCFIANDYKDFLLGKIKNPTGNFKTSDGKIIGKHEGIANYTVGQRRGLKLGGFANPLFVLEINAKNCDVIVGEQNELLKTLVKVENVNWLCDEIPTNNIEASVKLRSRHKEIPAIITPSTNGGAEIELKEPASGVAPGQGACFYQDDKVIGGGFITNDN